MKNYVISLKSECNRRNHIIAEFNAKEVQFDFFDALTPQMAMNEANNMGFIVKPSLISSGELACFMSHFAIWKKMIDENISYITIFEDDVVLSEDANKFLSSYQWIKNDWNIIKIEKFDQRVLLSKIEGESPDSKRELRQLVSKHYGCAGYIISLKAAKELIAYLKQNPELIPLDHVVFEHFMSGFTGKVIQLNPAICIQHNIFMKNNEDFPSSLELERRKRMKENKKKRFIKFLGEFSRIVQQIKLKLFGQNIEFK